MISSAGQLGVVVSSARYKRDIHDMDEASSNLMKLRPVTFRYKNDPAGTLEYGLVAEEVAKVYPELVSYGADGKAVTVHYHELVPMLLNEIQKLRAKVAGEQAKLASFEQRVSAVEQTRAVRDQNQSVATAIGR